MNSTGERVALVAGASGGIGFAVAVQLLALGHRVYAAYHRDAAVAGRFAAAGLRAVRLDVCSEASVAAVCDGIFQEEKRLDILVNCAGINVESPALALEDDAWRAVMDANLDGAFRLARTAAKYMLLGRWGRIVNLSSRSASQGGRGQINYAASKAGVEAVTRVLALELGRKGILVNGIAPGVIETSMTARIRREHGEALLEAIAVRRFGRPEEVAAVAAFLVSDAAAYVNGQTVHVDGGMRL